MFILIHVSLASHLQYVVQDKSAALQLQDSLKHDMLSLSEQLHAMSFRISLGATGARVDTGIVVPCLASQPKLLKSIDRGLS